MASENKSGNKRIPASMLRKAPLSDFFGMEGPLAHALPQYEMRNQQVAAAETAEEAMKTGRICLIEAGTGVGKTMAYLIPAVRAALAGKTTVISTHTINLQTQLMQKDIPLVLGMFPNAETEVPVALMKGRGNYLCPLNLDSAGDDLFLSMDPDLKRLMAWAAEDNCAGDRNDLPFNFAAWGEVTSTAETCRGPECRFFDRCPYFKARAKAAVSKIVVVNHALFFSDLAIRSEGSGAPGVLPNYDFVVFDEAHHLEDMAAKSFEVSFESRALELLMEKVRRVRGLDIDRARLKTIEHLGDSLFAPFAASRRQEFLLEEVVNGENTAITQDYALQITNALSTLQTDLKAFAKADETRKEQLEGIASTLARAQENLNGVLYRDAPGFIRWADLTQTNFGKREPRITLHLTPISVADQLGNNLWSHLIEHQGAAILTSATLANSGGFSFIRERLGLPEDVMECLVGSPFDYPSQAMLYVPAHLPMPGPGAGPEYAELLAQEMERVLALTKGRAFLLFTSRAMMNRVYDLLQHRLPYELFRQGDLPPGQLLDAFKASADGCLFGLQTFWEGVDVRGSSLSCVIIDKIPFAVPDTPLTKARLDAIEAAGGNSFAQFSIPQAQMRLKQGFGRLIRTHTDRGIVCILDSRILHKSYGPEFVKFLPPASRASKWPRVPRFWYQECGPVPVEAEAV